MVTNKEKNFSTLSVFLIFFGTMIGAGFASGREIYIYFARYGAYGLLMALVISGAFFVLGYIFLQLGKKCIVKNLTDFFKLLFGKFSIFFEILIMFSYIIVLSAMFAGFDSLQKIVIPSIKFPFLSVVGAILCVFVVLGGLTNISKLNGVLLPLLLVFVFTIFFSTIFNGNLSNFNILFNFKSNSLVGALGSSIIFVCSNMFLTGFLLMKTGSKTCDKVDKNASLLTGIVLSICILVGSLTIVVNPTSTLSDMPFLYLAFNVSNLFVVLSVIILSLAIFTTAVATMYTLTWWLSGYMGNKILSLSIVCVASFLLSRIGFSYIVDIIYPLMGFIDVIFIVFVLLLYNKKVKNHYI